MEYVTSSFNKGYELNFELVHLPIDLQVFFRLSHRYDIIYQDVN